MSRIPYELLIRFDLQGQASGLSARWLETVNGRVFEVGPEPLSGTNDAAFADFRTAFNASVQAQLTAAQASLATATQERDAAVAIREELEARIAELKAELNPPGPDLSTIAGAKQHLAGLRYAKETGGIVIGTQVITTERDEIGHWFPRFYDAFQWLQNDPATRALNPDGRYSYKPKNHDSVILTAQQVIRAYQCMAWYVNQCFAVEAAVEAKLNAGDDIEETLASIVWPQTQFAW